MARTMTLPRGTRPSDVLGERDNPTGETPAPAEPVNEALAETQQESSTSSSSSSDDSSSDGESAVASAAREAAELKAKLAAAEEARKKAEDAAQQKKAAKEAKQLQKIAEAEAKAKAAEEARIKAEEEEKQRAQEEAELKEKEAREAEAHRNAAAARRLAAASARHRPTNLVENEAESTDDDGTSSNDGSSDETPEQGEDIDSASYCRSDDADDAQQDLQDDAFEQAAYEAERTRRGKLPASSNPATAVREHSPSNSNAGRSSERSSNSDSEDEELPPMPPRRVPTKKKPRKIYTREERKAIFKAIMSVGFRESRYPQANSLERLGICDDVANLIGACGLADYVSKRRHAFKEAAAEFISTVEYIDLDPSTLNTTGGGQLSFVINGKDYVITLKRLQRLFRFPPGYPLEMKVSSRELDSIWELLTGDKRFPASAKGSRIRHPVIAISRRIIAETFHPRTKTGPCSSSDMKVLIGGLKKVLKVNPLTQQAIVGDTRNGGLAFALAKQLEGYKGKILGQITKKTKLTSLCMGGPITAILEEVAVQANFDAMTRSAWVSMTIRYMKEQYLVAFKEGDKRFFYRFQHPQLQDARIVLPNQELTDLSDLSDPLKIRFIPPFDLLYDNSFQTPVPDGPHDIEAPHDEERDASPPQNIAPAHAAIQPPPCCLGNQAELVATITAQLEATLTPKLIAALEPQIIARVTPQITADVTATVRSNLKEELKAELLPQLRTDFKENIITELQIELGGVLKEELRTEIKDGLTAQRDAIYNSIYDEIKPHVAERIRAIDLELRALIKRRLARFQHLLPPKPVAATSAIIHQEQSTSTNTAPPGDTDTSASSKKTVVTQLPRSNLPEASDRGSKRPSEQAQGPERTRSDPAPLTKRRKDSSSSDSEARRTSPSTFLVERPRKRRSESPSEGSNTKTKEAAATPSTKEPSKDASKDNMPPPPPPNP